MPWTDLWTKVLDWLGLVITPNWNDVIGWLPSLLALLLIVIFLLIAARWAANLRFNQSRVPRRSSTTVPPSGVHLPGPSRWPFILPIGAAVLVFGHVAHPTRVASPTVDAAGHITSSGGAPLGELFNLPLLGLGLLIILVGLAGWYRDAMHEWRRTEHPELLPVVNAPPALPRPEPVAAEPPPGVHLPGPSPWPFFIPIAMAIIVFGLVVSPTLAVGGVLMAIIAAVGWYLDAGREYRQVDAGQLPEPRTRDPERAFPKAMVGVYAVIGIVAVVLGFAPQLVGYVNASPSPSASASASSGGGGTVSASLKLTAKDVKFDVSSLAAPANTAFTITFTNDDAVPHNVAIFEGSDANGKNVFRGTVFPGPGKSMTYQVAALPAGSYYFHCDVHPSQMFGTLTVK
jgi:plastocyanin